MREILFKAKRIDNAEWVYWNVYGEFCRESSKRTRLSIKKGATTSYYDYIHQVYQMIDINTICQYTGLTDKNGNKIWENDIVEIPTEDEYFHLKWEEDTARFVMSSNSFIVTFDNYWSHEVEVIGNIFDNPELIGE